MACPSYLTVLIVVASLMSGCAHEQDGRPLPHQKGLPAQWCNCSTIEREIRHCVALLESDGIEVRQRAIARMRELCLSACCGRRLLRSYLRESANSSLSAIFLTILDSLPRLAFSVQVVGIATVGKPLQLRFAIRNISDEAQVVLGSIYGSDYQARFPQYDISMFGPNYTGGGPFPLDLKHLTLLREEDFVFLPPGAECDPFGENTNGHWFLRVGAIPRTSGLHKLTCVADLTSRDLQEWIGSDNPPDVVSPQVLRLLDRIPRVRLECSVSFGVNR